MVELNADHVQLAFTLARWKRSLLPPTAGVDVSDLESVALEGLVLAAIDYREASGSFPGYARTRVWFSMLDYLRGIDLCSREERKRARAAGEAGARYVDIKAAENTAVEPPSFAQLAVRSAIRQLPERYRIALWMRYVEDEPLKAIARRLGCSLSHAGATVQKGRELFRRKYLQK